MAIPAIVYGAFALACLVTTAYFGRETLAAIKKDSLVLHIDFKPETGAGNITMTLYEIDWYVNSTNHILGERLALTAAQLFVRQSGLPHVQNMTRAYATYQRSYLSEKTGWFVNEPPVEITKVGIYVINTLCVSGILSTEMIALNGIFEETPLGGLVISSIVGHGDDYAAQWAHNKLNLTSAKMIAYETSMENVDNTTRSLIIPQSSSWSISTGHIVDVNTEYIYEQWGVLTSWLYSFGPSIETVKLSWAVFAMSLFGGAQSLVASNGKIFEKSIEKFGPMIGGNLPYVDVIAEATQVHPGMIALIMSTVLLYIRTSCVNRKVAVFIGVFALVGYFTGNINGETAILDIAQNIVSVSKTLIIAMFELMCELVLGITLYVLKFIRKSTGRYGTVLALAFGLLVFFTPIAIAAYVYLTVDVAMYVAFGLVSLAAYVAIAVLAKITKVVAKVVTKPLPRKKKVVAVVEEERKEDEGVEENNTAPNTVEEYVVEGEDENDHYSSPSPSPRSPSPSPFQTQNPCCQQCVQVIFNGNNNSVVIASAPPMPVENGFKALINTPETPTKTNLERTRSLLTPMRLAFE